MRRARDGSEIPVPSEEVRMLLPHGTQVVYTRVAGRAVIRFRFRGLMRAAQVISWAWWRALGRRGTL